MALRSLRVDQFTAFESLTINFVPGINVVLGPNSSGKSHLIKLGYVLHRALETGQTEDLGLRLEAVFRPDDLGRLIHRAQGRASASVKARFDEGHVDFKLSPPRKLTSNLKKSKSPQRAVFLPSRELLAMFEGFIQAYEERELAFDETYFDGCKALSGTPLKGPRGEKASAIAKPIFDALGGRVTLEGNRFYVKRDEGNLEAHLVSEGLRKIAALGHLIANGTLREHGVLFWDEPEANLNPRLISQVVDFLIALARNGVQIVLVTHDHLLTRRLSLAAQYPKPGTQAVPMAFHSLYQEDGGPIQLESADLLSKLQHNAILDEFARFFDDEQRAEAESLTKPTRSKR